MTNVKPGLGTVDSYELIKVIGRGGMGVVMTGASIIACLAKHAEDSLGFASETSRQIESDTTISAEMSW